MKRRSHAGILVGSLVVTGLAAAVYVQEPNWPGAEKTINGGHVTDPDHRIVAVDDQGHVEQIDDRTGATGAVLPHGIDISHPDSVDVDRLENGQSAYIGYLANSGDQPIELVHLDTGDVERVGSGLHPALDPSEATLAYVRVGDGHLHLIFQNAVTGTQTDLGTPPGPSLEAVKAMTWSGDGQELILVSASDQSLWTVDRNARSFGQAKRLNVDTGSSSGVDSVTAYHAGFAMAVRRADGSSDIVEVATSAAAPGPPIATVNGTVTSLDSGTDHSRLLIAATAGATSTLYRTDDGGRTDRLTDHVIAASW